MRNEYVPLVSAAGVPESVAVPSPLSTNVTPAGSVVPPSSRCIDAPFGSPVVLTVNEPAMLVVNVALSALVIAGAAKTVNGSQKALAAW